MRKTYPNACLGFRCWTFSPDGLELLPLREGCPPWVVGVNNAVCQDSTHMAPAPYDADCHCGFNAYHALEAAISQAWRFNGLIIIGAIAGKGRVEVHSQGFRCEQAQILSLFYDGTHLGHADDIAEHYMVPLTGKRRQVNEFETEMLSLPHVRPISDSVVPGTKEITYNRRDCFNLLLHSSIPGMPVLSS